MGRHVFPVISVSEKLTSPITCFKSCERDGNKTKTWWVSGKFDFHDKKHKIQTFVTINQIPKYDKYVSKSCASQMYTIDSWDPVLKMSDIVVWEFAFFQQGLLFYLYLK